VDITSSYRNALWLRSNYVRNEQITLKSSARLFAGPVAGFRVKERGQYSVPFFIALELHC